MCNKTFLGESGAKWQLQTILVFALTSAQLVSNPDHALS